MRTANQGLPVDDLPGDWLSAPVSRGLAGIADRAEAQARRLRAYRHATEIFTGDAEALDLLARLPQHWTGDGDQLVAAVHALLQWAARP